MNSSPLVDAHRALRGALSFLLLLLAAPSVRALNIDLTAASQLSFGRIVATPSPGTVTVSPQGIRSSLGSVVLGNGFGAGAASFTVTGDAGTTYSITLPDSVQLTAGTAGMTVDGFTSAPNESGNLGPGGRQTITLGATLHVGANQPASSYSGSYVVIVNYD